MFFVDDDKTKNDERSTEKKQPSDCFVKKEIADDSGENRYKVQEYANLWCGFDF